MKYRFEYRCTKDPDRAVPAVPINVKTVEAVSRDDAEEELHDQLLILGYVQVIVDKCEVE